MILILDGVDNSTTYDVLTTLSYDKTTQGIIDEITTEMNTDSPNRITRPPTGKCFNEY